MNLPSGVVPAVRQPLVEDKTLLPFFSNARVIRAAGAGALSDWLLRHIKSCQWPHGDYHHSETVIHRYGTGAMVLCWHCDNQLRDLEYIRITRATCSSKPVSMDD